MRIDAFASEPQYRAHIAPVLDALPASIRGEWTKTGDGPVIVASYKDLWIMRGRPTIYMEHGAGQTYHEHPSYAGSPQREGVKLFLCPSQRVADLNARAHPGVPAVVIGCAKLDPFVGEPAPRMGVVAMAFHWNGAVCPETRSALPHYQSVFPEIGRDWPMIGTAHPRFLAGVAPMYQRAGIKVTPHDADIFRLADVLVCDNTSLGWEFLALDRPVVWLNAPWYRKDVEHGLRFWSEADAGEQVDDPADLDAAIVRAFEDRRSMRRREVIEQVYGFRGDSAQRGADAICEVIAA